MDAAAEAVWQRVVTPDGINDELRPVMTMSMPRGAEFLTVDNVPVGVPIGRAWLRLLGVLPFDYDYLTIAELEPGRHFREESTMLSGRGRPRCALQPSASAAAASLRRHDRLSTATHST
ncbi:MAG: hypothetical protein QOK33_4272 [Mycobacterium sp.]|nr:hypothetical protein [Mycobacterium sp.]MDT5401041.1 hypothetical protein [Mycobacterium sp.]